MSDNMDFDTYKLFETGHDIKDTKRGESNSQLLSDLSCSASVACMKVLLLVSLHEGICVYG